MLAFIQISQHGLSILASRSAEGSIWRDGQNVQVACVANVVGLQVTVCRVPYLDQFVPAPGKNDGIAVVGQETDTRHSL